MAFQWLINIVADGKQAVAEAGKVAGAVENVGRKGKAAEANMMGLKRFMTGAFIGGLVLQQFRELTAMAEKEFGPAIDNINVKLDKELLQNIYALNRQWLTFKVTALTALSPVIDALAKMGDWLVRISRAMFLTTNLPTFYKDLFTQGPRGAVGNFMARFKQAMEVLRKPTTTPAASLVPEPDKIKAVKEPTLKVPSTKTDRESGWSTSADQLQRMGLFVGRDPMRDLARKQVTVLQSIDGRLVDLRRAVEEEI